MIIVSNDKETILKLKEAGFKLLKESEEMSEFFLDKGIKFNFDDCKSKLFITKKMNF